MTPRLALLWVGSSIVASHALPKCKGAREALEMFHQCMGQLKEMENEHSIFVKWKWITDLSDTSTGFRYRLGRQGSSLQHPKRPRTCLEKAEYYDFVWRRCMEQTEIAYSQLTSP